MSRIGKLPITVPAGVVLEVADREVTVKGPNGTLSYRLPNRVNVDQKDGQVTVTVKNPDAQADRALWGLARVLIANMIVGVTAGFKKQLEINGVGYRASVSGQNLTLNLGFSHPVEFPIPTGLTISVEKNNIIVSGADKQLVGETAAKIRALKKPEPYKGKGIKYAGEIIRRKAGKVVKAAGAK